MEKTIQLDQRELQAASAIEQELGQMWAQVGMLLEQLEMARRLRDQTIERQKGVIRQALADRGISRFDNARPTQGGIIVTVPDALEATPVVPASKANGAPIIEAVEA